MCDKLYHTWTFSNTNAFRMIKERLSGKEYLKFSCPFAVVYVIKSYLSSEVSTLEKRNGLPYKQLKALAEIDRLRVEPYFFNGFVWERFQKFLKQIPKDADVFGKIVLEIQ